MSRSVRRRVWKRVSGWLVPAVLIFIAIAWIVAGSYRSRNVQAERYALPRDRSGTSMLGFMRDLDGEYDPKSSLVSASNLSSINAAMRQAAGAIDERRSELTALQLREVDYYRLHYGLMDLVSGTSTSDTESSALLKRADRYLAEMESVSPQDGEVLLAMLAALDLEGRTDTALAFADRVESRLSTVPDNDLKQSVVQRVATLRNRLKLLGSQPQWTTSTLSGDAFDIHQLQGKIVLVEFWSTTCGPCIADFPALKRIYRENSDRGFEIVGICLHASASRIESVVAKHQLPWIQICDDPLVGNSEWAAPLGINAVPTTMLLDRSGKVVAFGIRPLHSDPQLDLEVNLKRMLVRDGAL